MTPLIWDFTTNSSSNRYHAFLDGRAICGVPWTPARSSDAGTLHPGSHVACRQCEKLIDRFIASLNHASEISSRSH